MPDGTRENRIRLAVELLVEPKIRDSWGSEASLRYTRLRYELSVVRQSDDNGLDRLYVEHEALNFEEPENGVHPYRLKNIARVLGQLATEFDDPEQQALPLRQFLCNTHSPVFISQPSILSHVLFALTVGRSGRVAGHRGH